MLLAFILAQTVSQEITVTATRTETRIADTPASVVVLSRETLDTTAAPTLDEALRQVAGFTLFRRTGSRVANPTSQGVTLRGVGASGASRALVLDDGIPLNDPFGGWVYWGRVPLQSVGRVEVLRGGASDLYGSSAMGGVIQIVRRKDDGLRADVSAGSEATHGLSLFASGTRGDWSGSIAADLFSTDGYVLVRPEDRGAVDVDAGSNRLLLDVTLRRGAAFVRGARYEESRENGTPLQKNDTTLLTLAAGGDLALAGGNVSLRAWGSDQDYFQTFSAVAADRMSERLTVEQTVPSRAAGGTAQYTRAIAGRHVFVGGIEVRHARGTSEESRFTPNGVFEVDAGGVQRNGAVYAEDLFAISTRVNVTAGLRADWWSNDGEGVRHTESALNPRLSILWRPNSSVGFSASAYTAFRSPTLNELYRGFRVGNVQTLPNASLESEKLTGYEIGARARNARVTVFLMDTSDAIANVTLSTTPSTITRQRQNLGSTRSIGVELDSDWRFGHDWRASASWLYVDATVRGGELGGRRVPQVPRHQATAQLAWKDVAAQLRWSAMQFDDDLNELPLDGYLVADVFASHAIARGLEATIAIDNVLDRDVEASATPVVTIGGPRAWRVGLRYRR